MIIFTEWLFFLSSLCIFFFLFLLSVFLFHFPLSFSLCFPFFSFFNSFTININLLDTRHRHSIQCTQITSKKKQKTKTCGRLTNTTKIGLKFNQQDQVSETKLKHKSIGQQQKNFVHIAIEAFTNNRKLKCCALNLCTPNLSVFLMFAKKTYLFAKGSKSQQLYTPHRKLIPSHRGKKTIYFACSFSCASLECDNRFNSHRARFKIIKFAWNVLWLKRGIMCKVRFPILLTYTHQTILYTAHASFAISVALCSLYIIVLYIFVSVWISKFSSLIRVLLHMPTKILNNFPRKKSTQFSFPI